MKKKEPQSLGAAMTGATQNYKRSLRSQVDRACYRRIAILTNEILQTLPRTAALGEVSAALMFAATAFAEAAGHAHRIVELPTGED